MARQPRRWTVVHMTHSMLCDIPKSHRQTIFPIQTDFIDLGIRAPLGASLIRHPVTDGIQGHLTDRSAYTGIENSKHNRLFIHTVLSRHPRTPARTLHRISIHVSASVGTSRDNTSTLKSRRNTGEQGRGEGRGMGEDKGEEGKDRTTQQLEHKAD